MEYDKCELERLIFTDKLSYREIGRRYGVSDTTVKKAARKLGLCLEIRMVFPEGFINKGGKNKKPNCQTCKVCEKTLKRSAKKYCSVECQKLERYQQYLSDPSKYEGQMNIASLKPHILAEQNNTCAICQIVDVWNEKGLVFVLDHIDGNAANNNRDNLRLVCPNCDSQLDTFKSKNKNSARAR